jgi:hypothetical protein
MEFRNGILLQLFECIESTQNEVKRKMIETGACNAVPKSHARLARGEKVRVTSQLTLACSPITLCLPRARFKVTLRRDAGVVARRKSSRSFPTSIMRDDFAVARCVKEGVYGRFE